MEKERGDDCVFSSLLCLSKEVFHERRLSGSGLPFDPEKSSVTF